jgi:hypothetical protein
MIFFNIRPAGFPNPAGLYNTFFLYGLLPSGCRGFALKAGGAGTDRLLGKTNEII